jgi:crossover junction endodeoxyribonuclease RuvC
VVTAVVVGLDLSLTGTGVALPDGTVRTIASKGHTGATLRQRATRLHNLCTTVILAALGGAEVERDRLIVVEGPSMGSSSRGGAHHDRAGLWWLVVDALDGEPGIDVVEVAPAARAKYATGRGNASKDEVLAAVIRRYPDIEVRNNNEADALVLRAMGCDQLGQPLADVPAAHRTGLAKVAWPDWAVTA